MPSGRLPNIPSHLRKVPAYSTKPGSYSPTPSVLYSAGDPTVELLPQTGRPDVWQGLDYTQLCARVQTILGSADFQQAWEMQ